MVKLVPVNQDEKIRFVSKLARALQAYGAPANRLEAAVTEVFPSLDIEGTIFAMPTGIMLSLQVEGRHHAEMLRTSASEMELGKLSEVMDLAAAVGRAELTPAEGEARIDSILAAPARYGTVLTTVAFALTSSAASRFFGAGAAEMAAALVVGLAVGLLTVAASRVAFVGRLFDPIAGFTVSFLAVTAALVHPISIPIVTVAGLIVLVPGLTLTTAISELAQNNLVSGTARLNGAILVFLMLGFGVAAGGKLGVMLFGAPANVLPFALPLWTEAVAVVVACVTLTVLMRVPAHDFPWVLLNSVCSYLVVRFASPVAGPELGVFIAAIVAGTLSNAHSRRFLRPVAVTRLPSIMLLVPGGLGFTGISSMLQQNVLEGMRTAFSVAIIAVSLVVGLIISNSFVPPGRQV